MSSSHLTRTLFIAKQIALSYGTSYDQSRDERGHADDEDFRDEPYRFLNHWSLVNPARPHQPLPLPDSCLFDENNGKQTFYQGARLYGYVQPRRLNPQTTTTTSTNRNTNNNNEDTNHNNNNVLFETTLGPLFVEIGPLEHCCIDRSPTLRGYWVYCPPNESNTAEAGAAWYRLLEPHPRQVPYHLKARAQLAIVSNLVDYVFPPQENCTQAAEYAQQTVAQVFEATRDQGKQGWIAFDKTLLMHYAKTLYIHLLGAHSSLTEDCKFLQSLWSAKIKCKKLRLSPSDILQATIAAEERSNQTLWGEKTGIMAMTTSMLQPPNRPPSTTANLVLPTATTTTPAATSVDLDILAHERVCLVDKHAAFAASLSSVTSPTPVQQSIAKHSDGVGRGKHVVSAVTASLSSVTDNLAIDSRSSSSSSSSSSGEDEAADENHASSSSYSPPSSEEDDDEVEDSEDHQLEQKKKSSRKQPIQPELPMVGEDLDFALQLDAGLEPIFLDHDFEIAVQQERLLMYDEQFDAMMLDHLDDDDNDDDDDDSAALADSGGGHSPPSPHLPDGSDDDENGDQQWLSSSLPTGVAVLPQPRSTLGQGGGPSNVKVRGSATRCNAEWSEGCAELAAQKGAKAKRNMKSPKPTAKSISKKKREGEEFLKAFRRSRRRQALESTDDDYDEDEDDSWLRRKAARKIPHHKSETKKRDRKGIDEESDSDICSSQSDWATRLPRGGHQPRLYPTPNNDVTTSKSSKKKLKKPAWTCKMQPPTVSPEKPVKVKKSVDRRAAYSVEAMKESLVCTV